MAANAFSIAGVVSRGVSRRTPKPPHVSTIFSNARRRRQLGERHRVGGGSLALRMTASVERLTASHCMLLVTIVSVGSPPSAARK